MQIAHTANVGPFSVVGYEDDSEQVGEIGPNVTIGAHCLVSISAIISRDVTMDSYCRVGRRTVIGAGTQILYGSQIFAKCNIGENCIIAGEVPDRVTIEDNVTFMGDIAHSYLDASIPWNTIEEPSPTIRHGSVVGMRSLIIGPISIGPRSYIAAGEVVRNDIPADSVLYRGQVTPISKWRGFIKAREPQPPDNQARL
jgi:serine acetyltransferase